MAKSVNIQRKRIGGNFVVAKAIMSKEQREEIRQIIPDCIFINLTISKETQEKRILARHGDSKAGKSFGKLLIEYHPYFEVPEEGEEHTFNIDIIEDMTPAEVLKMVLEVLEK